MITKITINNKSYKIIKDEIISDDINHQVDKIQVLKTSETRKRYIYTWLPRIINKKLYWFTLIEIKEVLYFIRKMEFDDGWHYKSYWTNWKPKWKIEKVINE